MQCNNFSYECIYMYSCKSLNVKNNLLRLHSDDRYLQNDPMASFDFDFALRHAKRKQHATTLDEKIAKARKQQKKVFISSISYFHVKFHNKLMI